MHNGESDDFFRTKKRAVLSQKESDDILNIIGKIFILHVILNVCNLFENDSEPKS